MRNGNRKVASLEGLSLSVFTLPMRNGNGSTTTGLWSEPTSFYLTYEEWKLVKTMSEGYEGLRVFTLPMRNGNTVEIQAVFVWIIVFTLPMRNGNSDPSNSRSCCTKRFYLTYEEWKRKCLDEIEKFEELVFTLPMRNGNFRCAFMCKEAS